MDELEESVDVLRRIASMIRYRDTLMADVLDRSADVIEEQDIYILQLEKMVKKLTEDNDFIRDAARLPGCTCLTPTEKSASQEG